MWRALTAAGEEKHGFLSRVFELRCSVIATIAAASRANDAASKITLRVSPGVSAFQSRVTVSQGKNPYTSKRGDTETPCLTRDEEVRARRRLSRCV